VKPLNQPATAAEPRNICRKFAHHRILKVQSIGKKTLFVCQTLEAFRTFKRFGTLRFTFIIEITGFISL